MTVDAENLQTGKELRTRVNRLGSDLTLSVNGQPKVRGADPGTIDDNRSKDLRCSRWQQRLHNTHCHDGP